MKRLLKELASRGERPDGFDDFPRTWKLRYVLYRYGHRVAYVMLGIGLALALAYAGALYGRVEASNARQDREARATQRGRESTATLICSALNANSSASRRQAAYIKGLILAGAKQSKVFEPIYRQYGLPPYKQRLAQAQAQADGLDASLPPIIDCGALLRRIRFEVVGRRPPPPRAGTPASGR